LQLKENIGALTDKLYAFKNRCWELNIVNTIDIFDSLGSFIKVYVYGSEVKRILPLKNDIVNEEWISNKTRYFFEGLTKWRINIPLMKKLNTMVYISWIQAFYYFLIKIWYYSFFHNVKNLIFLNSIFVDYELMITSKILIKKLGFLSFNKKLNININDYYLYYLNPNFYENIKKKKTFIFVGYNLRLESPILNIKLRKKNIKHGILFFMIGSIFNDNLGCKNLGLNIKNLINYLYGKLKVSNLILKSSKKLIISNNILDLNVFLFGNNIINRLDNKSIINIIYKYSKSLNFIYTNLGFISNFFFNFCKYNIYYIFEKKEINLNLNILYINLSTILFEEFNLINNIHNIEKISNNDIVYLLGIDDFKFKKLKFSIFQGHHINLEYLNIDLIFPSTTFLERLSNYLDIEGNFLQTNFILFPPVFCRNDWSILNALYIYILNFINKIFNIKYSRKISYLVVNRFYLFINNINKVFYFLKKESMNFYYKKITKCRFYFYNLTYNINYFFKKIIKIYNSIINNKYYNPYVINIISENSEILKKCGIEFNFLIRNFENIK
jgi:hypothetical protein